MKVLLIVSSIYGTPIFKYYLGKDNILWEHLNPLTREKSFRLLQTNKGKLHIIGENFEHRTVESIDLSVTGRWTSNVRKSKFLKKSAIYSIDKIDYMDRAFDIEILPNSPINIDGQGRKSYVRRMIKVYSDLPKVIDYISDTKGLKFLPMYTNFEDGFNFCVRSYYQDNPEVAVGSSVDKIEELEVDDNFFTKFLRIPEISKN